MILRQRSRLRSARLPASAPSIGTAFRAWPQLLQKLWSAAFSTPHSGQALASALVMGRCFHGLTRTRKPLSMPRMSYEPFSRGPHPAGVRTAELIDAVRDRPLDVEIWYPAADRHRGQDVDPERCDRYELLAGLPLVTQQAARDAAPAAGRFPLVVFSHGYGGHRRQSTFLCTHLASHGYVVVAPDHTGNTLRDVFQQTIDAR